MTESSTIPTAGQADRSPSPETEVLAALRDIAASKLGWNGSLDPGMRLVEDLGLDSLRNMTLVIEVENHFHVCLDEEDEVAIRTVGDLVRTVHEKQQRVAASKG